MVDGWRDGGNGRNVTRKKREIGEEEILKRWQNLKVKGESGVGEEFEEMRMVRIKVGEKEKGSNNTFVVGT